MDLLLKSLPIFLTMLIVQVSIPPLLKYLHKTFPAKKGAKPKSFPFPSKEKPTILDIFLFATSVFLIIAGSFFSLIVVGYIKQLVLDLIFASADNLFVVHYGFGTITSLLLGVVIGAGAADLVIYMTLKIACAITGKTSKQIAPMLYSQSGESLGIDDNKLRIMLYGKIGGVFLIFTIIGSMGGYTRFTRNGIVHSDWPGLTQKTYSYQQISDVWHVQQFQNRVTGRIENSANYYVVVFEDGWSWKTTNLHPDMWPINYAKTGEVIDKHFIAQFLATKANVITKEGIKNIDVQ